MQVRQGGVFCNKYIEWGRAHFALSPITCGHGKFSETTMEWVALRCSGETVQLCG
ncbi:hypothetical protein JHK87_004451 [Glycine soja]|nr:hypothetical protein JHK87_004451 [Glycine soja]